MLGTLVHKAAALAPVPTRERRPRLEVPARRPEPPRGRFGWWLAAAAVVVVAGVGVLYRETLAGRLRPSPPGAIRTVLVRSGALEQTIRLTGTTAAEHSVFLRTPYLRGRRSRGAGDFQMVLQELTDSGRQVRKGEAVAAFDPLYMQNRLDWEQADRVQKEAQLQVLKAELGVKRAAHEQAIRVAKGRMDKAALDLKTAPVHSEIQVALFQVAFEEARASYRALVEQTQYMEAGERAEIRRAELDLDESRVEERRAEANLERMVVRAPIDGLAVVSQTFRGAEFGQIQVGDQLRPGQPYLQIVDPRSMIIEARANQADVEKLRLGAPAHVRFDAYAGLELPGRVHSIGPLATTAGRRADWVAEVPVLVKLDRVDPRVIPNLSVSADVVLRSEESAGIVPRHAVFYDAEDGSPYAYVRAPSGWEKRDLELGLANHVAVAVQSGLSPGEVIAAEPPPHEG